MFKNGDIVSVKNSNSSVFGFTYRVEESYNKSNSMSLIPCGKTKEAFAIYGYVNQDSWKYDEDYLRKIKLERIKEKICSK
jgi:hypothetical protein